MKERERQAIESRAEVLLSRAARLERVGLFLPEGAVRGAISSARRTEDSVEAHALLQKVSGLLNETRRRWAPVRDILREIDGLRMRARGLGVSTDDIDRRIESARSTLQKGPLSERQFSRTWAELNASASALKDVLALPPRTEPPSVPSGPAQPKADGASAHRAVIASVPGGAEGLHRILAAFAARGPGPPEAGDQRRSCPDCGRTLTGSFCPGCRKVWGD